MRLTSASPIPLLAERSGFATAGPAEAFEDVAEVRFRNADTGVGNDELDHVVREPRHHFDLAVIGELQSIREQVEQCAFELFPIGQERPRAQRGVERQRELEPAALRCGSEVRGAVRYQLVHVLDGFGTKLRGGRFEARRNPGSD